MSREVRVGATWLKQLLWTEGFVRIHERIVGASYQVNERTGDVIFLVEDQQGWQEKDYRQPVHPSHIE